MKRLLRAVLIGGALAVGAFLASMIYAGWKSNPDLPDHAAHRLIGPPRARPHTLRYVRAKSVCDLAGG